MKAYIYLIYSFILVPSYHCFVHFLVVSFILQKAKKEIIINVWLFFDGVFYFAKSRNRNNRNCFCSCLLFGF